MQLRGSVVATKFFITNFSSEMWTVKQFLDPQLHLAKRWKKVLKKSIDNKFIGCLDLENVKPLSYLTVTKI